MQSCQEKTEDKENPCSGCLDTECAFFEPEHKKTYTLTSISEFFKTLNNNVARLLG